MQDNLEAIARLEQQAADQAAEIERLRTENDQLQKDNSAIAARYAQNRKKLAEYEADEVVILDRFSALADARGVWQSVDEGMFPCACEYKGCDTVITVGEGGKFITVNDGEVSLSADLGEMRICRVLN